MTDTYERPAHLSVSQLVKYLRCGEQYRYRYIVGQTTPPTYATEAGTAIHEAIARYPRATLAFLDRAARFYFVGMIWAAHRKHGSLQFWGKQDYAWYVNTGIPAFVKNYITVREQDAAAGFTYTQYEAELRVSLGGDLPEVLAYIDLVGQSTEGIFVRDWKTGNQKAEHNLQLDIYAALYEEATGRKPSFVQGCYLKGDKPTYKTFVPTLTWKNVVDLFTPLLSGVYPLNGPISDACGLCDYKGQCHMSSLGSSNTRI